MSAHGERLPLPVSAPAGQVLEAACPATGGRYRLVGDVLTALDAAV